MRPWFVRALWMGLLHGAVQTGVAAVAVRSPEASSVGPIAIGLLIAAAVIWGAVDTLRDLPSRGMQWFIAALIAGPFAGALGVIGSAVLVDQTGQEALWVALTGGAAFTALLVLAPAGLGMLLGGFLVQKNTV
ncbi:B-4DMT family transporter [Lentzea sp. BCCO 10_0856]|uniref:B-4DMT family transporter n=1 Tax=Lentzea miocenica TaxID=3095431 RepID=A0ABU4T0F3_9PSEU|nr:B-4DMT family transporter [Lentzea sp. BCCO 10_0856]MDX8031570.1 B-4DMT family transporter [Lentzea sp. BCCO 10_0856]